MITVDRNKPIPLYHQVRESLRDRIEADEWAVGERIPAEKELAIQYGVSQITIKQALQHLAREGLVNRMQGKGTFVSRPLTRNIPELVGFSAGFAQLGVEIETQVISKEIIKPGQGTVRRLQLQPGELVIELQRLRLKQGTPICLQTSYLVHDLCRPLLNYDLGRESLFDLLSKVCNLELVKAEETLNAVAVDDYEGKVLQIPEGSPAFLARRITFHKTGQPVEYVKSILRGDQCKFTAKLSMSTPNSKMQLQGQSLDIKSKS